jgi:asparagine synthase (glutamine-hydrolysing)
MCGIAGILSLRGPLGEEADARLRAAATSMAHRGPDDEGFYRSGEMGFAFRRLSILDLAGGHQPMGNEDGSIQVVFNGEIYNYRELTERLKASGHVFKTRSDTEVLVHLYEEVGENFARELRGMFAIALWDSRRHKLLLVRDRLGIKPLHYGYEAGRFVFASELGALLVDEKVDHSVDWTAIDAFFTYGYVPAPWTAFRGARKLLPGHYLIVSDRGIEDVEYWDLAFEPKATASPRDLEEEFIRIFREAVRLQLLSEVPLGAFLSGGVDSSLVVGLMAETSGARVNSFPSFYAAILARASCPISQTWHTWNGASRRASTRQTRRRSSSRSSPR